MTVVSPFDLLHQLCRERGLALLLVAEHTPAPFGTGTRSKTRVTFLDVLELDYSEPGLTRRQRLRAGDLVLRCDLDTLDGDLEAAAELLAGLLAHHPRPA